MVVIHWIVSQLPQPAQHTQQPNTALVCSEIGEFCSIVSSWMSATTVPHLLHFQEQMPIIFQFVQVLEYSMQTRMGIISVLNVENFIVQFLQDPRNVFAVLGLSLLIKASVFQVEAHDDTAERHLLHKRTDALEQLHWRDSYQGLVRLQHKFLWLDKLNLHSLSEEQVLQASHFLEIGSIPDERDTPNPFLDQFITPIEMLIQSLEQ